MKTTANDKNLATWDRLDARRVPSIMGKGPDSDEPEQFREQDDCARATDANPHRPEQGFWKKSEDLRCRAGKPMASDERGLPKAYGLSKNWLRVDEERALYPSKGEC